MHEHHFYAFLRFTNESWLKTWVKKSNPDEIRRECTPLNFFEGFQLSEFYQRYHPSFKVQCQSLTLKLLLVAEYRKSPLDHWPIIFSPVLISLHKSPSFLKLLKFSLPIQPHPHRSAPAGPDDTCRRCACQWLRHTGAVCESLWRPEGSLCSSSGLCGRWWIPESLLHWQWAVCLEEERRG